MRNHAGLILSVGGKKGKVRLAPVIVGFMEVVRENLSLEIKTSF